MRGAKTLPQRPSFTIRREEIMFRMVRLLMIETGERDTSHDKCVTRIRRQSLSEGLQARCQVERRLATQGREGEVLRADHCRPVCVCPVTPLAGRNALARIAVQKKRFSVRFRWPSVGGDY